MNFITLKYLAVIAFGILLHITDGAFLFNSFNHSQRKHPQLLKAESINNHLASDSHHFHRGPPINASYELDVKLPVIGHQRFRLEILNDTYAELIIEGMLKIRDRMAYRVEPTTGKLHFNLSDATKKTLKRFRTSLKDAGYDSETDTPFIQVNPPLPMKINLKLQRMN